MLVVSQIPNTSTSQYTRIRLLELYINIGRSGHPGRLLHRNEDSDSIASLPPVNVSSRTEVWQLGRCVFTYLLVPRPATEIPSNVYKVPGAALLIFRIECSEPSLRLSVQLHDTVSQLDATYLSLRWDGTAKACALL